MKRLLSVILIILLSLSVLPTAGAKNEVSVTYVIKPSFDFGDVRDFHEGFAAVEKGGKWGFVDKTGKEVVPLIYESVREFSEGFAWVKKDGKWGIIANPLKTKNLPVKSK
ncbi:KWG Leptospira repeat protein [Caldicellulosiruptor saccharolyticus DSM 8903]|uniref:KWG Leptospira repeat protein n=1 Tax=Caldicellulosiruptor saccharolyticus (strain ATCC 43494 / DSM 8903 / Tp8T 6331) TaxID=351627 RepID=A4XG12_CALS8|nr:WG repeat-containing protein [Caldicellulosiruptor saccharolyticus]ABP65847.1 KWG Leptospira repeat protein [Caldicellulosiruptor saccharolyticus DSM 8903]